MSIEQKLEALTAAIEANTAALLGGAKATTTAPAADKPAADKPAAEKAKPGRPAKPAAYEAKHTKSEAQAAVNEVKEKLGVATAKGLIKQAGGEKLADITTDEAIDKLYDLAKEALGADGDDAGDEDGI